MPVTYNLIASNTLSSAAASVTFSAIPGTYTDLVLKFSARCDAAGAVDATVRLELNANNSAVYSTTVLNGNSSTATSYRNTGMTTMNFGDAINGANATANTFSSNEIYLPNYLSTTNKPLSHFLVTERNSATSVDMQVTAGLAQITSAITEVKLYSEAGSSFVSGSSFFLYGIKNS